MNSSRKASPTAPPMTLPRMRTASQRPTTSFLRSWHQVPSRENTKIASCGAGQSVGVQGNGRVDSRGWTVHHGATHRGTQPSRVAARWPGIWAWHPSHRACAAAAAAHRPGGCPVRTRRPWRIVVPTPDASDASARRASMAVHRRRRVAAITAAGAPRWRRAAGAATTRRRPSSSRTPSASSARPTSRSRTTCPSPRNRAHTPSTSTCPATYPAPPGPSTRCPTAAPGSTSSAWRPGRPRSWATRWPTRARACSTSP